MEHVQSDGTISFVLWNSSCPIRWNMSNLIEQFNLFYEIVYVRFDGTCPITKNILSS